MTAERISDPPLPRGAERSDEGEPSAWRLAIVWSGVALTAVVAVFSGTASSVAVKWYESATFSHGFLIIPIIGYLVWDRRHQLSRLVPKPAFWAVGIVAAGALGWLLGHVAGVLVVQQLALVVMINGVAVVVLGWRVGRAILFPLAYLFFAVPIGEFLVPYLQDITAYLAVRALRLVSIPVFKEGLYITVPTGSFVVAEICSGLRFLIANIALGCLFANLSYRSWSRRVAFMVLCVVVPVVANGLRAFGIILLAHLTNNRLAVGVDHIVYGWVFFTFVMLVLLGLGMTFREKPAGVSSGEISGPPERQPASSLAPRFIMATVAALLVAATAPAYALYIRSAEPGVAMTISPPEIALPWTAVGEVGTWQPKSFDSDLLLTQSYEARERRAELVIVYYSQQTQGREVVGYRASMADNGDWTRLGGGHDVAVVDGSPLGVSYDRYRSSEGNKLVWYWYWVDGVFTGNPYLAKLLEVRAKLFGGVQSAAIVVVATDFGEQHDEATDVLRDFLISVEPLGPVLLRIAGRV